MKFVIPELVAFIVAWAAIVAATYAIVQTNEQHVEYQKAATP